MARSRLSERDDLPKAKITGKSLKSSLRILVYLKPYKWKFILGLIFLLLTSFTALAFPMLMGKLVDAAQDTLLKNIDRVAIYLLILFSAQAVFSFFRIYLFVNVTENMLASLRIAVYGHMIKLPMAFFSQRRVGELNSRISSDISQLQETFTTTSAEFLRQLIIIIGGVILLSYTSIRLTFMMLALVPVLAILAVFFGRRIRKISGETQDIIADSNTIVEETLQGIAVVKAFANELYEIGRYNKSADEIVKKALRVGIARGAFASFVIFCLFGSIVAVIWYGVRLVNAGELSVGKMFSFVLYSVFVGASIGGITELYAQIQKAVGATERLTELLDEQTEDISALKTERDTKRLIEGSVGFQHVKFTYPSRKEMEVLNDISFKVAKGERIALVGPSGAGKSTIVSLLLRFYDPDSGSVTIDGKDTRNYPLTDMRNCMAVVPQDILLFGGSIRENIAYGNPEATEVEILDAARKANALQFIESFPENLNTLVGERGVKLSGGQRQRIAIARAVLKNPSILILDEATSSLDAESERLVQAALDELMECRTTFIIAHRLATVRKADKILVIDKGKVIETGTHEELVQKENGLYRSLSNLQFQTT